MRDTSKIVHLLVSLLSVNILSTKEKKLLPLFSHYFE